VKSIFYKKHLLIYSTGSLLRRQISLMKIVIGFLTLSLFFTYSWNQPVACELVPGKW